MTTHAKATYEELVKRLEQAEKWAKTMEHERDWERDVVQVDLQQKLEEAERDRDQWQRVAREYETALADRGLL